MSSRATFFGLAILFGSSLACTSILGISDPVDEPSDDSAVDVGADVVVSDSAHDSTPTDSLPDSHTDAIDARDAADAEVVVDTALDSVAVDTTDVAPPPDTRTMDTADAPCSATYRAAVLADAPIDFWELDETSGTTAHDSGSKPHDGSFFGTASDPTFGAAGAVVCSTATYFHGAGLMSVAGAPSFAGGLSFSVELWVRPDTIDATKRFIIGRATATAGGWYMYSQSTGLGFVLFDPAASSSFSVFAAAIGSAAYTHVVATYDSGGLLSLYENGILSLSMSGTFSLPAVTGADMTVAQPAGIGLSIMSGPFDEIALYDYALTATQVGAHYAAR